MKGLIMDSPRREIHSLPEESDQGMEDMGLPKNHDSDAEGTVKPLPLHAQDDFSSKNPSSAYGNSLPVMAPRWKRKAAEAKALSEPMSIIISKLEATLGQSNSQGLLSGSSVLVAANPEQTELFNKACFGCPIITTEKDKQWFQLSLEEAFYLGSVMKCIDIIGEDKCIKTAEELWHYMISKKPDFIILFKAYAHLRMKNWVVRSGSQYGTDFVAYRHHPALVHSEYAVLVLSSDNESRNARLRVWSDIHCTLRLSGSVAKTLLALYVNRDRNCRASPLWLEHYVIEERVVSRWNPELSRGNQTVSSH